MDHFKLILEALKVAKIWPQKWLYIAENHFLGLNMAPILRLNWARNGHNIGGIIGLK